MIAKAVTAVRQPRYPTRLEVLDSPDLLRKHMPAAWKKLAETTGAVGLLLLANSFVLAGEMDTKDGAKKPAIVAPIFEHGEGRGATGCVVINPPVFLSEQDAMQVIREEMSKVGVQFAPEKVTMPEIRIKMKDDEGLPDERLILLRKSMEKGIALDGLDPKKRVAVQYVNHGNYYQLGGLRSPSTVQGWYFKEVASAVSQEVSKSGKDLYYGAFYDPVVAIGDKENQRLWKRRTELDKRSVKLGNPSALNREYERAYKQADAPARAEAKRLLRMQVRDFIKWLKGQGVI